MMQTALLHKQEALRKQVALWRAGGQKIALVPTMGALHAGHVSLVEIARSHGAERVMASIFVNPSQFGPNEDYARYPRTEAEDIAALEAAGVDAVYLPAAEEIYPPGFATSVTVKGVSEGLCGAFRPGHFDGVATVVAKLLLQSAVDLAVFGEKDYQQLMVIHRLVRDLDIPVAIFGAPVVREADGLALSSRNRYLGEAQRGVAAMLYATLSEAAAAIRATPGDAATLSALAQQRLLAHGFDRVDYVELRAAEDLAPLQRLDRPARLLAAAWLGNTRLIDNIPVEPA